MARSHGTSAPGPSTSAIIEQHRRSNGQFGEQARAEEDPSGVLSLDDWDYEDYEQSQAILRQGMSIAGAAHRRTNAADRGVDVDDVAQEAFLALHQRKVKGAEVNNIMAYLTLGARSAAVRAGRQVNSTDITAYKRFVALRREREDALGRSLSQNEEQALVKEFLADWTDTRHRPNEDFVSRVRGAEKTISDEHWQVLAGEQGEQPIVNDVQPGSWLDRSLDHVEGEQRDLRAAKDSAWNALAERAGAPVIAAGHLGHRKVTAARALAKGDESIESLLERWEDGDLDPETERVLFSPWENQPDADRAAIKACLNKVPGYTDDLWQAALTSAAVRKSGNTTKSA